MKFLLSSFSLRPQGVSTLGGHPHYMALSLGDAKMGGVSLINAGALPGRPLAFMLNQPPGPDKVCSTSLGASSTLPTTLAQCLAETLLVFRILSTGQISAQRLPSPAKALAGK